MIDWMTTEQKAVAEELAWDYASVGVRRRPSARIAQFDCYEDGAAEPTVSFEVTPCGQLTELAPGAPGQRPEGGRI